MISGLGPIAPIRIDPSAAISRPSAGGGGSDFKALLEGSIQNAEAARTEANQAIGQFLAGEREDLHKVLLTAQRADLTFDLFVQVRNKVTQAYQEIMRMPL